MSASSALPGHASNPPTHSQCEGRRKSSLWKIHAGTLFFRVWIVAVALAVPRELGAFQNGWQCCMVMRPHCSGNSVQGALEWQEVGTLRERLIWAHRWQQLAVCDRTCSLGASLSEAPRFCWKMPKAASWHSWQVCFPFFFFLCVCVCVVCIVPAQLKSEREDADNPGICNFPLMVQVSRSCSCDKRAIQRDSSAKIQKNIFVSPTLRTVSVLCAEIFKVPLKCCNLTTTDTYPLNSFTNLNPASCFFPSLPSFSIFFPFSRYITSTLSLLQGHFLPS